jgi:hypothetical protein
MAQSHNASVSDVEEVEMADLTEVVETEPSIEAADAIWVSGKRIAWFNN